MHDTCAYAIVRKSEEPQSFAIPGRIGSEAQQFATIGDKAGM
jgi:hypothetical protein